MANVFISHTQADNEFVSRLAHDLDDRGLTVWSVDQYVQPGDDWAQVIEEAISSVSNVLVVLSNNSATSEWVSAEAAIALTQGVRVVPIYATKKAYVPFMLRATRGVDLSHPEGYLSAVDQLANQLLKEEIPREANLVDENRARLFKAQLEALVLEQERLSLEDVAKSKGRALFVSLAAIASLGALTATLFLSINVMDDISIPLAVLFGASAGIAVGFVRLPFSRSKRGPEADE